MASPINPTHAISLAIHAFSTPSSAEEQQPTPLEERAEENEETLLDRAAALQNDTVEISPRAEQESLIASSGNPDSSAGAEGNNEVVTAASLGEEGGSGTPRPGSYVEAMA